MKYLLWWGAIVVIVLVFQGLSVDGKIGMLSILLGGAIGFVWHLFDQIQELRSRIERVEQQIYGGGDD